MLLGKCFLSICACVLVHAVRREEVDVDSANAMHALTGFDSSRDPVSHDETSGPALVGEQVSSQEMQQGLLKFLDNMAEDLPSFKEAEKKYVDFLEQVEQVQRSQTKGNGTACQKQMGGLIVQLERNCTKLLDKRHVYIKVSKKEKRKHSTINYLDVPKEKSCKTTIQDIFLYGEDIVRAQKTTIDEGRQLPNATKEFFRSGFFLKQWIVKLATAKKAAILWAGFWTNASDPEGHKSRTSKESLSNFADLIETQTVHPSTELGRMVVRYSNLEACQGNAENFLKGNMWSLFSFSFIWGMKEKKQDLVVALVHKELDGARPLNDSILFQYEIPSIGLAAWGTELWSPHVVIIDLLGTCAQTSPLLRRQLYAKLPGTYEYLKNNYQWSKEDFIWRSRLSWTCLDCPHSHCHLDEDLAEQVKSILQAKREQDRQDKLLIKAMRAGKFEQAEELVRRGADVNFQDEQDDTALFFAAEKGNISLTEFFLNHGAYVDARNILGETPLLRTRSWKLQDLLVKHGAKKDAKSFHHEPGSV